MFWDVLSVFRFLCGGGVGTLGVSPKFLWVDFVNLGLVASPGFLVPNGSTIFLLDFRRSRDVCRWARLGFGASQASNFGYSDRYGCFLNGGTPDLHPKMIHFLVGKPHGCWGFTHHFRVHPHMFLGNCPSTKDVSQICYWRVTGALGSWLEVHDEHGGGVEVSWTCLRSLLLGTECGLSIQNHLLCN